MSLSLYKEKRKFDKTPEPRGKSSSSKGALRFVVQKHDASHLHYDFRLELGGVLVSWAVPKGPSLNTADKRLAMHVEDHPLDYRNLEGVIPEGNYGGGTVIVWDEGEYWPLEGEELSRKEQEKLLKQQHEAGNMKIVLKGKKLKGAFALFLMKGRGERSWILQKKDDRYASETDVLEKDKSVKSGKTLAQIAKVNGAEVKHPDNEEKVKKRTALKTSAKKKDPLPPPPGARKSALPKDISPMLATLTGEAFDDEEWMFEIKWDGYRSLAYCSGGKVSLVSRNKKEFTEKYEPVASALAALGINAVFDGEIVAVNEKGLADFQSLQNWQNTPVQLQYFIFDILWKDGYDLTSLPLLERKMILRSLIPEDDAVIKFSDHVVGNGKAFFDAALKQGLEGIMAKKSSSVYTVGERTADWLKVKTALRQEVVIAGFTEPRNTRKYFGSLLLGVYDEGELVYVGHTGSGFNAASLQSIHEKLQSLIIDDCPFDNCPRGNMPVTWVKPELVCEIKFTEWTKDHIARHPIFQGLRSDKKAKQVVFEKASTMAAIKSKAGGKKATASKKAAAPKKAEASKKAAKAKSDGESSKSKNLVSIEEGKDQEVRLNGHTLQLTNLDKLYWKKEGFSKGDMINYYMKIAPYILPYMKDRPQSLNRHPNGITGPNFYQKDQKGKLPSWMQTHEDFSESTNKTIEYLVCKDEATLIYMANLGCIEMHPWHSRTRSWQKPDWCLIDLDPDKGNSFEQVMDVAKLVKSILDGIGADAYCKTSGSTGIHIYIPLAAKYDYEQSKQFAELLVNLVQAEMPGTTSVERNPAKRKGKIYLDYLQNRETQTAAAAYSLRPKPGMPVSTPLDWSELKKGLTPTTYNALNIFDRLKTEGDLFQPVLGKGVNLKKLLASLATQI